MITFVFVFFKPIRMTTPKFHHFQQSIDGIELPHKFTNPFHYTPHPLTVLATAEVQTYLQTQTQWHEELEKGKMFGVLIVQNGKDEIGYLAAFSGNLANSNQHDFFVPPVYDLLQPDGFFRIEEDQISAINHRIESILKDPVYTSLTEELEMLKGTIQKDLQKGKAFLKQEKERREEIRQKGVSEEEQAQLIRESQFQKAEFKRLERKYKDKLSNLEERVKAYENTIQELKKERKKRSATLQVKLFSKFEMLNANGAKRDLCDIFAPTTQQIPPAGAGECAAPKLLQFAYCHNLQPLAMAEFWWGNSPKTEIRHHGYYYPACKGKCEPILKHMLIGLDVEENTLLSNVKTETELEILFEDEDLVVINKPAGMLSVPGKGSVFSVFDWAEQKYPKATGPLIVHRLDMATSGLLVIAKKKEIHQNLQAQFKNRTVKKRYIAWLDGLISTDKGNISLPICPNPLDRPRQMVNELYGKPAITEFEVIERRNNKTKIAFYPITGRTHQLRVHAAHPEGLNTPIVGDELYGKKADRLYLHAEYLEFNHPRTNKRIAITKYAEF